MKLAAAQPVERQLEIPPATIKIPLVGTYKSGYRKHLRKGGLRCQGFSGEQNVHHAAQWMRGGRDSKEATGE